LFVFFFFSSRRRHTRFSRDWSSDVCSSDLVQIISLCETEICAYIRAHEGENTIHTVSISQGKKISLIYFSFFSLLCRPNAFHTRSEERRVGKECRSRSSLYE